jgi:hypothetical protein
MLLDELRTVELRRAVAVEQLAVDLGLGSSPTLAALGAELDEPWAEIFELHRSALATSAVEIRALAESHGEDDEPCGSTAPSVLAWLDNASWLNDAAGWGGQPAGDPMGESRPPRAH